jgi:hypothetical protein
MAAPTILDQARFEARARFGDVVALGVLVVAGAALLTTMYLLGDSAASAAATGGSIVFTRDRTFVQAMFEGVLVAFSLGWIVYRLFSRAARRHTGGPQ